MGVRAEDLAILYALNQAEVPAVGSLLPAELSDLLDLAKTTIVRVGPDVAAFIVLIEEGSSYTSPNYRWFAERLDRFAYVDRIVVAPAHQRSGLGRLLYARATAVAGDRPLCAEVNTRPRNEVSLVFHDTLGFIEMGRLTTADGAKEVVMLRADAQQPVDGPVDEDP